MHIFISCLVTRMQDKIVTKGQLIIVQTCSKDTVIKTVTNQNYFHEKFKNRLSLEVSVYHFESFSHPEKYKYLFRHILKYKFTSYFYIGAKIALFTLSVLQT